MNKKGFTLIELLTVIAILGILVLLAAPKFLGYTEKANIAKIQTGIKAVETAVDLKSLENPEFTADLVAITPDKLQEINDSGKLIDKNGFIKENLEGGKNVPLKDLDVKWNSGGEFIVNEEDDSVYYYNKDINVSKNPDGSSTMPGDNNGDGNGGDDSENTEPPVTEPEITYPITHENGDKEDEDGTITKPDGTTHYPNGNILDKDGNLWTKQPDGNLVGPDGSVMLPDDTVIPVAKDSDFTWINAPSYGYFTAEYPTTKGYYKYTGTGEEVVNIPHVINGTEMTSYIRMFFETGADVKKVISTNTNVTNMQEMFSRSQATSLDLSLFDTSLVTTMNQMFYESQATSLDLSSFDISNVTDVYGMFLNSQATSLDLSSFDTSNVVNMGFMFEDSKATTGYARTQSDADKLNASSYKPSTLTFTTK